MCLFLSTPSPAAPLTTSSVCKSSPAFPLTINICLHVNPTLYALHLFCLDSSTFLNWHQRPQNYFSQRRGWLFFFFFKCRVTEFDRVWGIIYNGLQQQALSPVEHQWEKPGSTSEAELSTTIMKRVFILLQQLVRNFLFPHIGSLSYMLTSSISFGRYLVINLHVSVWQTEIWPEGGTRWEVKWSLKSL